MDMNHFKRCTFDAIMATCSQKVWVNEFEPEEDHEEYCYYHVKIREGIIFPMESDYDLEEELF